MKIVHVIAYFNSLSRYQEYYLAKEQIRQGHDVHIVTSDRNFPIEDYEVTWKPIYGERIIGTGIYSEDALVIHRLPILFELRSRLILIGLRRKLSFLRPDLVIVHNILTPHSIQLLMGKKIAPKIIFDDHMTYAQVDKSIIGKLIYFLFRLFFRKALLNSADKIVAISEGCIKTLNFAYGIPKEKISLIPLGADSDIFKFDKLLRSQKRKEMGLSQKEVLVTFTGKVYKERKVDLIIKALDNLKLSKQVHFLVLGTIAGSYREEFMMTLRLTNIPFSIYPMASTKDLVKFMCASDICVYTLPTISTLEASACKRAVICSNETPERFKNNNGIGIDLGDLEELQKALDLLINNDSLRELMGQNGRNLIEEEFSWKILSNRFLE